MTSLSVREIEGSDIELIIDYWLTSAPDFLTGMGVDLSKMPSEDQWKEMLSQQIKQGYTEKTSYCIIWLLDNKPVGHSNVNKIIFGKEAYMHLHIWYGDVRKQGLGREFIKLTLPFFFQNLELTTIYCEPFALNPAPNKILEKLGFHFIREYITTPGFLNFEQSVNRWELSRENFEKIRLLKESQPFY